MRKKVRLGSKLVGDGEPVYIIAEGGLTNWGSLELAKRQVDAAMAAGADCVKFQAQNTEALVSKKIDPYWYKRLKYKELSRGDLMDLRDYCLIRNIDFLVTAHTDVDLEFLDKDLGVGFFKIGSGESLNSDFLKNVGSRGKTVVISLGLHLTDEEVLKSIKKLEDAGTKDIAILHCNTVYPTPPEINYLNYISRLKKIIPEYPVGYSDHTVGWHIPIAAVALGACVIEKHISFDKRDKRSLDCPGSCEPDDLKDMVAQIREVEKSLSCDFALREQKIKEARTWAQQSIVAAKNILSGMKITRDLISFKRPGKGGLSPDAVEKIIGKTAKVDIEKDEQIQFDHLS